MRILPLLVFLASAVAAFGDDTADTRKDLKAALRNSDLERKIHKTLAKAETTQTVCPIPGGRSADGRFDILLVENQTGFDINGIFNFVVFTTSDRTRILGIDVWQGDYDWKVPGSTRAEWNKDCWAVAIRSHPARRITVFDLYRVTPSRAERLEPEEYQDSADPDPPGTTYGHTFAGPIGWANNTDFMHYIKTVKILPQVGGQVVGQYHTLRVSKQDLKARNLGNSIDLSERYLAADNELNAAYKHALGNQSNDQEKLRDAQRQWIRDRDAGAAKLNGKKRLEFLIDFTKQRSQELIRMTE